MPIPDLSGYGKTKQVVQNASPYGNDLLHTISTNMQNSVKLSGIDAIVQASREHNYAPTDLQSSTLIEKDGKVVQAPRTREADPFTKGLLAGLASPLEPIVDAYAKPMQYQSGVTSGSTGSPIADKTLGILGGIAGTLPYFAIGGELTSGIASKIISNPLAQKIIHGGLALGAANMPNNLLNWITGKQSAVETGARAAEDMVVGSLFGAIPQGSTAKNILGVLGAASLGYGQSALERHNISPTSDNLINAGVLAVMHGAGLIRGNDMLYDKKLDPSVNKDLGDVYDKLQPIRNANIGLQNLTDLGKETPQTSTEAQGSTNVEKPIQTTTQQENVQPTLPKEEISTIENNNARYDGIQGDNVLFTNRETGGTFSIPKNELSDAKVKEVLSNDKNPKLDEPLPPKASQKELSTAFEQAKTPTVNDKIDKLGETYNLDKKQVAELKAQANTSIGMEGIKEDKFLSAVEDKLKTMQAVKPEGGQTVYHGTYYKFDNFEHSELGIHFGTKEQARDLVKSKAEVGYTSADSPKSDAMASGETGQIYTKRYALPIGKYFEVQDVGSFKDPRNYLKEPNVRKFLGTEEADRLLEERNKFVKASDQQVGKEIEAGGGLRKLGMKGAKPLWDAGAERIKDYDKELYAQLRQKFIDAGYKGLKYKNAYEGKGEYSHIILEPEKLISRDQPAISTKSPTVPEQMQTAGLNPDAIMGTLVPGAKRFAEEDLPKIAKSIKASVKTVVNDFENTFAPEQPSLRMNPKGELSIFDKKGKGKMADAIIASTKQKLEMLKSQAWDATIERNNAWDKVPVPNQIKFMMSIDEGKDFSDFGKHADQMQELANEYKQRFDNVWQKEKESGLIAKGMGAPNQLELFDDMRLEYLNNYFPHIWKDPAAAREFFGQHGLSLGKNKYANERTIKLLRLGLENGLELKTTNPEQNVLMREFDSTRLRLYSDMMNQLNAIGLVKPYDKGSDTGYWSVINAPDGKKYFTSPEAGRILNNAILQPSLWSNETVVGSIFRGMMKVKNLIIPFKLGLSLFHPLHILTIDMSSRRASIYENIIKGNPSFDKGLDDIMVASAGLGQFRGVQEGLDAMKGYKNPQTDYDNQANQTMYEGGFSPIESEVWRTNAIQNFKKALRENKYASASMRAIPAIMQSMQKPIFEYYIPALKTSAYLEEAKTLLERRPDLADDSINRSIELRKIAKSIDNRYGELNYNTLFWNRYAKDLGVGTSLSLGWNLGFFREYGGAAIDFGKAAKDLMSGNFTKENITRRMLFTLDYTAQSMIIGGLITRFMTGQTPSHLLDYFYPRTGRKNEDGSDARLNTPFYTREFFTIADHIQKEGLVGGTVALVQSKLQPTIGTLADIFHNKDFYGYEIRDVNDPLIQQLGQLGKFIGTNAFLPISMQSQRIAKEQGGTTGQVLSYLGFNPAPRYITNSATINNINNLYDKRFGGNTRPLSQKKVSDAKRDVRDMIKSGLSKTEIMGKINEYIKNGTLTYNKNLLKNLTRQANSTFDEYAFSAFVADDQKHLIRNMSDNEFIKYLPYTKKDVFSQNPDIKERALTLVSKLTGTDKTKVLAHINNENYKPPYQRRVVRGRSHD